MATMGRSAKESIELSLVDLMRSREFASITVKEITQHAHVSRVSFYRNFSSKEDVLEQFMADRFMQLLGASSSELPDHEVQSYLREILTRIARNAEFVELLQRNGLGHLLYRVFMHKGSAYIEQFQPSAVPYQDTYYTGGTLLVIMQWIDRGMPESPEELAGIIDTLYYRRNF